MYSKYKKRQVLEFYDQCGSISKAIQQLGYPSRKTLYVWIEERASPPKNRVPRKKHNNQPDHPLHPSAQFKLEVIYRCFELGENVQLVSEEIGYSRASIYTCRRKYIQKGAVALMNTGDAPRGKLPEGEPASPEEVEILKSQLQKMQLEIDILKETLEVLKKDPGVDLSTLRNQEKAVIIGALKNKYSLPLLLQRLQIPKSSCYYHQKIVAFTDKNESLRARINILFVENSRRYGYRRIHALLRMSRK